VGVVVGVEGVEEWVYIIGSWGRRTPNTVVGEGSAHWVKAAVRKQGHILQVG